MDSWQIWRQAILRVATSTAETLEAKVIKLFFYEVGFILDLELDKVRLVCSSEYALRSFAPYSWRCFAEVKALLRNPNLGYSLEIVSPKEQAVLRASGKLPQSEFLAGISLAESELQAPSTFPKVDCIITSGPTAGFNPINVGVSTFPQGLSPLGGACAAAWSAPIAPSVAPPFPQVTPVSAPAAQQPAQAAADACASAASAPAAAVSAPDTSASASTDFAPTAAASRQYGSYPIQEQSAAAVTTDQVFGHGGEAATDVVKTGDLASLRLTDNSSFSEEHDTNHREFKTSSWVTAPQPSNCVSGIEFSEPAQDDAVHNQTYDRQSLNNSDLAQPSAEGLAPEAYEFMAPPVSCAPVDLPPEDDFVLAGADMHGASGLGVELTAAGALQSAQPGPSGGTAAKFNQNAEALAARINNTLLVPPFDYPEGASYDDWYAQTGYHAATSALPPREQFELFPFDPDLQPPQRDFDEPEIAVVTPSTPSAPHTASVAPQAMPSQAPQVASQVAVLQPVPQVVPQSQPMPAQIPAPGPQVLLPPAEVLPQVTSHLPPQDLVPSELARPQSQVETALVSHQTKVMPEVRLQAQLGATLAHSQVPLQVPQAQPVAQPVVQPAAVAATALSGVPQSVQDITRCEELADEILQPTHASALVREALNVKAQREQAARSASIAALPKVVSGPMASVYAAAAKRKRNCSSLPQPNALLSQEKVQTTTLNPDEPAVLPAPELLRQVEQGVGGLTPFLPNDGSRHQLNLDNFKLSAEQIAASKKLNQVLAEQFKQISSQRLIYKARQAELAKNRAMSHKRKGEPQLLERFEGYLPGMDPVTFQPLPQNQLDPLHPNALGGMPLAGSPFAPQVPEQPELTLSVPTVEVNPVKTFSTYVSDTRNFEILNAASLLAQYVGVPQVNPFLLYGDSGVGKTHILHAIANAIAYYHPEYKVAFIRAEEFLQNYVSSISESGKNRFADSQIYFQQAFLQYDVLIFDDIQALAKGVKSRQVFFEVISAFLDRPGTQLIVASNQMPRELKDKGFDASLLSRMGSGLCMPLLKPNWANRRDIVNAKCQEMGITMSEDIVDYISMNLNPNVREIEGALKTLHSFLNSNGSLTYDDAVRTLSGFISAGAGHVLTISEIQSTVAKEFGVSVKDLLSSCKKKAISQARSLAMTIARDVIANNSLNDLGRAFKKDHTSVHEAIVRTRDRLQHDSALKEKYDHIIKALSELARKP